MAQQKNRRNALIAALAVLVVALAVGGTIAWLTAQDQVTNTFTVGNFQNPGNEPETDDPEDPNDDSDKNEDDVFNAGGYLFETEWPLNADGTTNIAEMPRLTPGTPTAKNPNVGIGANSDDAYVFLYIQNDSLDKGNAFFTSLAAQAPYFKIQKQWLPVETAEAHESGVVPTASSAIADSEDKTYVDGLFMYVWDETAGEGAGAAATTAQVLHASHEAGKDVYTGELFEFITMPNGVDTRVYKTVDPNVKVYAFIYGAQDGVGDDADGSAAKALEEAIAWAKGIKDSN